MKHVSTAPATTRSSIQLFAKPFTISTPHETSFNAPAIGQLWQGQGGIYAGEHEYPEGMCHVVFSASDLSGIAYGGAGSNSEEFGVPSLMDGRMNTHKLTKFPGNYPAAEAAQKFQADGHNDFYLPSLEELERAHQLIFDSFKLARYLSSTECS